MSYIPVEAKGHTPPYKIHRYYARRPWNVFNKIIELNSSKDDIILDPFAGGGTTIYEGIKLGRKMIGLDINPLSIFIIKNMVKKFENLDLLDKKFNQINQFLSTCYNGTDFIDIKKNIENRGYIEKNDLLKNENSNNSFKVLWNELAHQVKCDKCKMIIPLSNKIKIKNGRYSCLNKNCSNHLENNGHITPHRCTRSGYKYLYSAIRNSKNKQLEFININKNQGKKYQEHLLFLEKMLLNLSIDVTQTEIPLTWDRQSEDLLFKKGIKNFEDLFTSRNLYINFLLKNKIDKIKNHELREIFRFIFSSSLRHTNIMSFTNPNWNGGKPNAMAKHAYWIPSQFCEYDIIVAFNESYNRFRNMLKYNNYQEFNISLADNFYGIVQGSNNLLLRDKPVYEIDIPDNSVDLIVTDPPYGSNVQYLELSHFWYPWNKDLYNSKVIKFKNEAVMNRKNDFKGFKDVASYEENLYLVFNRCYSLLVDNGKLILTFNNKDFHAWIALLIAIFRSGFSFNKGEIHFQYGVQHYRQTAHTKNKNSIFGDFIYVFHKSKQRANLPKVTNTEELSSIIHDKLSLNLKKMKSKGNTMISFMKEILPHIEAYCKTRSLTNNHNIYRSLRKQEFNKLQINNSN